MISHRIARHTPPKRNSLLAALALSATLLAGCGGAGSNSTPPAAQKPLTLDLELPASVTGGSAPSGNRLAGHLSAARGSGEPCAFIGADEQDPFRNGYQMTKFMVSAIASWTCVADVLIDVAGVVPHDGVLHETDNDTQAVDYDADDPTHYSVSDDSTTQTTIRFYYGYDRSAPPRVDEDPQFFISWNKTSDSDIEGRLIIDASKINPADNDPEDPLMMRMDFNYSADEKLADMYLRFADSNAWADGLRIQVIKDLNSSVLEQVFLARGLMNMKAQFIPATGITETPLLHMYTVSNGFGEGAAMAEFQDIALPLELNQNTGNHLGNYLFTKNDVYFFDSDQDWDWVNKTISSSEFRGSRTTPSNCGTFIPFDPSLDIIATELNLGDTYFSGNECAAVGDDCSALLNGVFEDGFADQEPNQGSDPNDWRSTAVANPVYLNTVYPNGSNWNGAFDFSFTPSGSNDNAVPVLPRQSTLTIPFDNFSSDAASRNAARAGNWAYSAINVGVWNTIISVGMAIPVATFAESFNHQPVLQTDGSWEWQYSVVTNAIYNARLNGKLINGQVQWKMYISKSGEFENFLWYSGEHDPSGTAGSWRINKHPSTPGPLLSIDWAQNATLNTGSVKYTNIDSTSNEFGGFIAYAETTQAPYDREYDIFNKGLNNITEIEWNNLNHNGRVRDQKHFGSNDWQCWNNNLQDSICP